MSIKLKFVTNSYKNGNPIPQPNLVGPTMTKEQFDEWQSQFIEGEPEPVGDWTVKQLKAMGMTGLYLAVFE